MSFFSTIKTLKEQVLKKQRVIEGCCKHKNELNEAAMHLILCPDDGKNVETSTPMTTVVHLNNYGCLLEKGRGGWGGQLST